MTHFFMPFVFSFLSLSSVKQLYGFGLNTANSITLSLLFRLIHLSSFINPTTFLFYSIDNDLSHS